MKIELGQTIELELGGRLGDRSESKGAGGHGPQEGIFPRAKNSDKKFLT